MYFFSCAYQAKLNTSLAPLFTQSEHTLPVHWCLTLLCTYKCTCFPSQQILDTKLLFLNTHSPFCDFSYPKCFPMFSKMRAAFLSHLGKYSVISSVSYNCLSFVTRSLENCCLTALVQT